MELKTALYLIPVSLSPCDPHTDIPPYNKEVINNLKFFVVENIRTARRFIKKINPAYDIGEAVFFELNRRTDAAEISSYLDPLRHGESIGVMSEAGCPGVADPGAEVVALAQKEGMTVVPLIGPSSILLSLMASGFDGQKFCFNGYLPVDTVQRNRQINKLEEESRIKGMTQIFIETPYRNNKMMEALLQNLKPSTRLCVAANITDPRSESIKTMTVAEWKKINYNYDKQPSIFLFLAEGGSFAKDGRIERKASAQRR